MTDDRVQLLRRSPLHDLHTRRGGRFVQGADADVLADMPGAEDRALILCDLTPLPRAGVKGWNAAQAVAAAGLPVPAANNTSLIGPGNIHVARLGDGELLLLSDPLAFPAVVAPPAIAQADGIYAAPRRDSHFWFCLLGPAAPQALAKICAVDFRPSRFAEARTVAQTSAALLSVIVLRFPSGPAHAPGFHLLGDVASANYFWGVLVDAIDELGGAAAGLDRLRLFLGI